MASSPSATPKRLLANPGASPTTTAVLFNCFTHATARSRSSGRVALAITTSINLLDGTGLKKWSPRIRPGRTRACDSLSSDTLLVLDAMTASGAKTFSIARRVDNLRSRSSGTASMTRPAPARSA